jgi:hyperosmotically inducible protein
VEELIVGGELLMFRKRLIKLTIISISLAAFIPAPAKTTDLLRTPNREVESRIREASTASPQARLLNQIRRELVTLPYYSVFDWLEGELRPDGTVVLRGAVVRPTTKSDAEARIKDIEGVQRVVNEIEVLPPSPTDDRLRVAVYNAIFGSDSPLFRYAHRAVPPIHIIVKNGRVTLKGVVATESEKNIAYTRASAVPGIFEVKNELQVEK